MQRQWISDKGFLTFAFNTLDIDYLDLAYRLALSIKETQKENNISLITDSFTADKIKDKHEDIFDTIIIKGKTDRGHKDFSHEALAWDLTPYKQTIKVEADILILTSIDHWWDILDTRDVVLTTNVFKHTGELITNRSQRRLFDDNDLPDVYNAIYYFRYTRESQRFFDIVKQIYNNWAWFRDDYLINCRYENPVTDEVFAIAARIFGVENCTLPHAVPAFVHMKNPLLEIPSDGPWWDFLYWEKDSSSGRIGHYAQTLPVHYQRKDFWHAR
jgi:hypothetical protein